MYQIVEYTDLNEYTKLVLPALYRNEVANSRNIGLLDVWQKDGNYKRLIVVLLDNQVVGSAIQGNKANSHLALSLMSQVAAQELAYYLSRTKYLPTTVTGDKATFNQFMLKFAELSQLHAVIVHDLETLVLHKDAFTARKVVNLRDTTVDDYKDIYCLNWQFYASSFPLLNADELNISAQNEATRFTNGDGYLLVIDEQVVGFVAIVRKTDNYWGVGLLIIDVCSRGYGYGRILIDSISEYILKQNKHAVLTVEKQNMVAREMYYECGYVYHNDDLTYRFLKD